MTRNLPSKLFCLGKCFRQRAQPVGKIQGRKRLEDFVRMLHNLTVHIEAESRGVGKVPSEASLHVLIPEVSPCSPSHLFLSLKLA